jgi:hypothetical protein
MPLVRPNVSRFKPRQLAASGLCSMSLGGLSCRKRHQIRQTAQQDSTKGDGRFPSGYNHGERLACTTTVVWIR